MAKADNSNGRVTMAVISTKLDTVIEELKKLGTLQSADHDRIGELEGEVARVKDRQSVAAGLQAGLSMLLSALAAWWGSRP